MRNFTKKEKINQIKFSCDAFWHLAYRNNFGNFNKAKARKVEFDLTSDREKKICLSFYLFYVNICFQLNDSFWLAPPPLTCKNEGTYL